MQLVEHDPQQPYLWYQYMREKHPLWYDEEKSTWHVFRYADVQTVLMNPKRFSSAIAIPAGVPRIITLTDDPAHRVLRSRIAQAFTPRRIESLAPRITEHVNELLLPHLSTGRMDLVTEFADPLPVFVIAELLGVPGSDRHLFRSWSSDVGSAEPLATPTKGLGVHEYFRQVIRERQKHPHNDLITALCDQSLSEEEILGFCQVILIAGIETIKYALGNIMRCVKEFPEIWLRLRAQPTLIPSAIEEALRYYSPQSCFSRVIVENTELHGEQLQAGTPMTIWFASANRDERQFADADRFAIERNPNPHLAFGQGIHFCLGAPLARLTARIVLNTFVQQINEWTWIEPGKMATGIVYGPLNMATEFVPAS